MSDHTISSRSKYEDLEPDSFDRELTKAKLALNIIRLIEAKDMTHEEAAACLGVTPPQITDLKVGQLDSFTIDQLFCWLKTLDCDVETRLMEEYKEQGLCWRLDDEGSLKITAILFPLSIIALTLPYWKTVTNPPEVLFLAGGLMLVTFWFLIYQSYEDRLRIRWKRIHEIEWILRLDAHLMMDRERAKRRIRGELIRCFMFIIYLVATIFIILDIKIQTTHAIARLISGLLDKDGATLQVLGFEKSFADTRVIALIEWGVPLFMVAIVIVVGILGFMYRAHLLSKIENKE